MAYKVVVSGAAARQAAGMPAAARITLASILEQLAEDPWSGQVYDVRWSPEFRTIEFGESGLATYVISERRQTVLVEQVIWTG